MANSFLMPLSALGVITALLGVMASAISAGRMLLHLRKHDLATYARLGEPAVLSRYGSPLTQQYLRERRYLQSENERVRTWGRRYHMSLRVAIVGFFICGVALVAPWLSAI